ncbi:MAG: pyruvate dehydrogenase complex dihydrolipoamide acetyltransferase [Bacteroidetes bacterium]|nr:MAG: pyruvate dehydrogenase complex dihydrolipoamide acetyltransferase [Bacteroidota bacterium]TAF90883.1 MAG: pyruvate dehydrogenase complex dihydrolipoamide acetyltransferase [Bacteroidota bacterium]
MAELIRMPRLSDTMTEGVIATWNKNVGDTVKKGDVLAEIETDKATMELESYQNGVLLHIGAPVGGKLQVDDLLAIIGTAGEDVTALIAGAAAPTPVASAAPTATAPATPAPAAPTAPVASGVDYSKMDEVVLMPRLSDTMTEGVIAAWTKEVGDTVKKGDILAEIETDKATMELESYKDGILLHQGAKAGEKIQVNDLLAIIGKADFDIQAVINGLKNGGSSSAAAPAEVVAPQANTPAPAAPSPAAAPAAAVVNEGRIFASPLAKKIAAEKGIDLKYVPGTGDNGRIVRTDVENFVPAVAAPAPAAAAAPAPVAKAPVAAPAGQESFELVQVTQMRKTIARRLSESLFTAPHFYLTMKINMDAAIEARALINELGGAKISFNDLVVKATAVALTQHPAVNSSWLGDTIRINHHVNIGVAVAVEDGLLVPVVRHANTKSLSTINAEVKDFAGRAKAKKLQPSDWEGSTFTISNLGMFGIDSFTAIINPPDACILAVGGISQEPIVKNGAVVPGNVMNVTLSCDHRVVDGATGAAFLQTLKGLLEEPLRMLL